MMWQTLLFFLLVGCGKREHFLMEIHPTTSLTATVGQDIDWSFQATRGKSLLSIIEATASATPFGVKPVFEKGILGFKGKVLGTQIQSGLISVVAFDKAACDDLVNNTKKFALKSAVQTGSSDAVIPVLDCVQPTQTVKLIASGVAVKAVFRWTLDAPGLNHSPEEFIRLALATKKASRADSVASKVIGPLDRKLPKEGPDSKTSGVPQSKVVRLGSVLFSPFELTLGECGFLPRENCGSRESCVWAEGACLDSRLTGRGQSLK